MKINKERILIENERILIENKTILIENKRILIEKRWFLIPGLAGPGRERPGIEILEKSFRNPSVFLNGFL